MKIFYVHLGNVTFPNQQAHSVQIFNTCAALVSEGAQLWCVANHEGLERGDSAAPKKWPLSGDAYFGVEENFQLVRPALTWQTRFKRKRTIQDFLQECVGSIIRATPQPDVIYTRSIMSGVAFIRRNMPTVLEVHNLDDVAQVPELQELIRACNDEAKSRFLGIVAISQILADDLVKQGIPASKVIVAHDGISMTRFAQHLSTTVAREMLRKLIPGQTELLDSSRPVVGYCGHFYEGRGIEMLLDCARRQPQWTFLLIGGFEKDVERYRKISEQDSLQNVIFTGYVANTDLAPYMWACDVLAMPYERENPQSRFMSPMKMFEYMAAGRAIVSADWPQIREVLRPEHNALLHTRGDRDDLESTLKRALNDAPLRERLSQNARRNVENYTWRARARLILNWLEQSQNVSSAE